MSYKYDDLVVIANKYQKASSDAKAQLYETYDQLRDLTVSGPTLGAPGYGAAASFLINLSKLIAPASFMPLLGNSSMNIPGTSFFSSISGGNSITPGGLASFGLGKLGNQPGFPGGAAPIMYGLGALGSTLGESYTLGGEITGGAASLAGTTSAAGALGGLSAGYGQGDYVLPVAGLLSGVGGIMSALGPYFGPFGLMSGVAGNVLSGFGGAAISTYQNVTGRIINNADTILSNKVRNIETVCKQLDAQADIVRKLLKEGIDSNSKAMQNL